MLAASEAVQMKGVFESGQWRADCTVHAGLTFTTERITERACRVALRAK